MRLTITTTASQLDSATIDYAEVICLRDASANILLGGSDVTSASNAATDGWAYKTTDQPMVFRVPPTGLWARTVSGSATVEALRL